MISEYGVDAYKLARNMKVETRYHGRRRRNRSKPNWTTSMILVPSMPRLARVAVARDLSQVDPLWLGWTSIGRKSSYRGTHNG